MSTTSFDRLLNLSRVAVACASFASPDRDRIEGMVNQGRRRKGSARFSLSSKLDKRLAQHRYSGGGAGFGATASFDKRQRAIVKLHYFNHAGGGGGALKARARCVARDAAGRDEEPDLGREGRADDGRETEEAPGAGPRGLPVARGPSRPIGLL
ncbi:MAG: hypothetical protein ABUS57_00300 [Pseudomonadota bacterium]